MEDVVTAGPGLAFVSYPTAIAKFDWAPQVSFFKSVVTNKLLGQNLL